MLQESSGGPNYGVDNNGNGEPQNVKYETKVLKSDLCDYADAYILVTGGIFITRGNANSRAAFKNCAPFIECSLQINDEHIETAENLDVIMPMYNLIEY